MVQISIEEKNWQLVMSEIISCKDAFLDAVSERRLENYSLVNFSEGFLKCGAERYDIKRLVRANGELLKETNSLVAKFKGKAGSYQMTIKFPDINKLSNGISVRYRIRGWDNLRYLAIGHTQNSSFNHVKIPNPSLDEWVTFSFSYEDVAYCLQNGWSKYEPFGIEDLRLYISGAPLDEGGYIEVEWGSIWLGGGIKELGIDEGNKSYKELTSCLSRYFSRCNPSYKQQVEDFFLRGSMPLTGDAKLEWPIFDLHPKGFSDSGTYRYLWHAMQPAISMMIYAEEEGALSPLFSAREFINSWLENSYINPDDDKKYAWYDHGAAERLMAFLLMYFVGLEQSFDFRFMSRLQRMVVLHAHLLESETFYSSFQSTRYHNHAWFQDIALISVAVAFPNYSASRRWLDRAVERLTSQFDNLIVRDSGYSIFVENSIGYHHGVQRLVDFAGELIQLSDKESEIIKIAEELDLWTSFFKYPDKRNPTHGDTFRRGNSHDGVAKGKAFHEGCVKLLSKAGYAVVKGVHSTIPFMMSMIAPSLCKTHKHEDNLAITLFFDGVEWLIDPSMYSHEYTAPIPAYLRSAIAHNSIAIPELDYSLNPGLAKIAGKYTDVSYEIDGEHEAYDGLVVKRKIVGRIDELIIEGHDEILWKGKEKCVDKYLVFHAGEEVQVDNSDDFIKLSHPRSKFSLKISSNYRAYRINYGWCGNPLESSCSGLGFMQAQDTFSILYRISDQAAVWRIEIVSS